MDHNAATPHKAGTGVFADRTKCAVDRHPGRRLCV